MRMEDAKIRDTYKTKPEKKGEQRSSLYTETYRGEYYNIETKKLIPFKNQARKIITKESIEELASTIKTHGIRQPLTIIPSEQQKGRYEIVSGERRWRAAQFLDMERVPCIILKDKESAEEVALIENVQRKDLHPLELMRGVKSLLDKGICKNHQEVAKKIGINRTAVVEALSLQKLPISTQERILKENIRSRAILRSLLKTPKKEFKDIVLEKTKKSCIPSNELFTISLQQEKILFNKKTDWKLTQTQREEIKEYLKTLIKII